MEIKDTIKTYIKTYGIDGLTAAIDFLILEVSNIITYYRLYILFLVILCGNIIYISDSGMLIINSILFALMLLIVILIPLAVYKLNELLSYRNIIKSYKHDYDTIVHSDMETKLKQIKITYLISAMLNELSRKTKTTEHTIFFVLRTHDKNSLEIMLR